MPEKTIKRRLTEAGDSELADDDGPIFIDRRQGHCPLGAHLSRHIRDAAGLRVSIGSVASRLALSWPDLPGQWLGRIKEATSHCLL
jgi:hypothetical protein